MQVEREVYRQARGGGSRTRGADQPRRSERNNTAGKKSKNKNGSGKSTADQKVKTKNLQKKKQQQKQPESSAPLAPTKKATNAAKKALRDAGFQAPKGMKMVISYVSTDSGANANGGGKKKNAKPSQKQNQQQQKKPNNDNMKKGSRNSRR